MPRKLNTTLESDLAKGVRLISVRGSLQGVTLLYGFVCVVVIRRGLSMHSPNLLIMHIKFAKYRHSKVDKYAHTKLANHTHTHTHTSC